MTIYIYIYIYLSVCVAILANMYRITEYYIYKTDITYYYYCCRCLGTNPTPTPVATAQCVFLIAIQYFLFIIFCLSAGNPCTWIIESLPIMPLLSLTSNKVATIKLVWKNYLGWCQDIKSIHTWPNFRFCLIQYIPLSLLSYSNRG